MNISSSSISRVHVYYEGWYIISLRSKRFQSSYCEKVRAGAKKFFFCSCASFLDEPREETLATQVSILG